MLMSLVRSTLLASCTLLAACGQNSMQDFDDRPRQDVWHAVVQASREPRYPDWIVIENQVSVDDATQTTHFYRLLMRDLVTPGLQPQRQEQTWRFTATVLPGSPTRVELSSPDWAIPAHFWAQSDHFFAQIRMRLTEMGPVTPVPGDPLGGAVPPVKHDPAAPGDPAGAPDQSGLVKP